MDDQLAKFLETYHERLLSGDVVPEENDAASNSSDVPGELQDAVLSLRWIERVRRLPDTLSGAAGDTKVATGTNSSEGWTIGRFQIVRELGRGGHGIVFLAWDPTAQRHVALKTPHPHVLFTSEMRQRFLREGIVAARLAHRNILPVLEVDHRGAVCFIVTPFCTGPSLASYLANRGRPLEPRVAAQWIAALADGVEHAHRQGVLHRDIKPANVLLKHSDERSSEEDLIPQLTDFGLAKLLVSEAAPTRSGALLGTPAYMAPEQIDANIGEQSTATDIYGLGVLLYELLVGEPPFGGVSDAEVIHQVLQGDPREPRRRVAHVPRDLEAICLKCLTRTPASRYGSASDLSDDLQRFLSGKATIARPLKLREATWKAARRHPTKAVALLTGSLAITFTAMGTVWHISRINAALTIAESARVRAEQHQSELQQLVFYRDLQDAHKALNDFDARKARRLLQRQQAAAPESFLWRHLLARCFGRPTSTRAHKGHAHSVEFSPDGTRLLTSGADGQVVLWSLSGSRLREFGNLSGQPNCARFSPDGKCVAAAEQNRVHLWKIETGSEIGLWTCKDQRTINWIAWSPDGQSIAAAGKNGSTVTVVDVSSNLSRTLPVAHTDEINDLSFSPDGKTLATASSDKTVALWDIATGKELCRIQPKQAHVMCVRFSPDGRLLATSGGSGTVLIWRVDDGSKVAEFICNSNRIDALAFSPREPIIAFGDGAGIVRQWRWKDDALLGIVDSGCGRVMAINFEPNGRALACTSVDGSLHCWDFRLQYRRAATRIAGFGAAAAFSADSKYLFVSNTSTQTRSIFERRGARWIQQEVTKANCALDWIGAPTGNKVLAFDHQKPSQIRYWSLAKPRNLGAELKLDDRLTAVAASPDQQLIFTAALSSPGQIEGWQTSTDETFLQLSGRPANVHDLVVSPDGKLLAAGGGHPSIQIWRVPAQNPVHTYSLDGGVYAMAFSPDSRMLAAGGRHGIVDFWRTDTGVQGKMSLVHKSAVTAIAYCPTEPIIVTGDDDGYVRLWNLTTGEELMILGRLPSQVNLITFSPDTQWLAAGTSGSNKAEAEIRMWHSPDSRIPPELEALDH